MLVQVGASSAQRLEPAPPPSVTLPEALARILTDYEIAWRSKDAAALAMLFAEDGFVLSSGSPPVRGRTEGFARQKGEPDVGKFTLTLRKTAEGRWLIVSDMDNGNARPVGVQGAFISR